MKLATCTSVLPIAVMAWLAAPLGAADASPQHREVSQQHGQAYAGGHQTASARLASQIEATPEPIPETPDETGGTAPWHDVETHEFPQDDYDSCEACGGGCHSRGCLGGLWYGSVDYLLFRPRMSQDVAAVRHTETTNQTTQPETRILTNKPIQFPFKYESGFRVAAGYRLLDCGGDIRVSYWRMTNDAQFTAGPVDTTNNSLLIFGNLGNNPGDGEFLNAESGVTANIFDVDFAKSISMGGPCGACGGCGCPRWDLRFFAGARIADITRFNNNAVVDDQGNGLAFGEINARFVGAGPRVGIQGRRYFGACGLWSVFAKASGSILIGDYREGRARTQLIESPLETQLTIQNDRFHRTIPVTDIEVGGRWQMAPYTFVSVGYFFQAWWDLGQGETISGDNIPGTYFGPLDTSNILGFDGLFVRGEMFF